MNLNPMQEITSKIPFQLTVEPLENHYTISFESYFCTNDEINIKISDGLINAEVFCKALSRPGVILQALCKLFNEILLLSKDNNKEKLRIEIGQCWNLLGAIEESLLIQLGNLIDKNPKFFWNLSEQDKKKYRNFLRLFNDHFVQCAKDLGLICLKNGFEINQFTKLANRFMLGIPSPLEKVELDRSVSSIIILLSLTEDLAEKKVGLSLSEFLLPYQNQFIQDLSSRGFYNNQTMELFNSGFYLLKNFTDQNIDPTFAPLQIVTSLNSLCKMIDIPSVQTILNMYYKSFTYLPSQGFCQADKLKIIASYLNLAYKLDRVSIGKILVDKYRYFNRLISVKIVWKELENPDIEHSIEKEEIILYADAKKVDHRNLASWANALTTFVPSVTIIKIPSDWLCSSPKELKRKREDQDAYPSKKIKLSSPTSSKEATARPGPGRDVLVTLPQLYEQLPKEQVEVDEEDAAIDISLSPITNKESYILPLISKATALVVNGIPNKSWSQSIFTHMIKHLDDIIIEFPIEYLYSDNVGISTQVVNETMDKYNTVYLDVSVSLKNTNEGKLQNQLSYLNSLTDLNNIMVKVESDQDISFLSKIVKDLSVGSLNIDIKVDGLSKNFDCHQLALELSPYSNLSTLPILLSFIIAFPELPSTVYALSYLLKDKNNHDAFVNSDILKNLTYSEIEILMTLVHNNRGEFLCYPQFLARILDAFIRSQKINEFVDVNKSFEEFVLYLLENHVLSIENCKSIDKYYFLGWLLDMICSKEKLEAQRISKNLHFIADSILNLCLDDNRYESYLTKIASLFIEQGYIPPHNEVTCESQTLRWCIFQKLVLNLHLPSELKNQWVETICAHFFPYDYGDLDESKINSINFSFYHLLNYNNFTKKNKFVFVNPKYINKNLFFFIYKDLIKNHKYICEVDSVNYFMYLHNYLDQLLKFGLNTQQLYDQIVPALTVIEDQIALGNDTGICVAKGFLNTLNDHSYQGLLEEILKKMVVFTKEPYKKKIYTISGYLADILLINPRQLSEEVIKLCARAALHTPYVSENIHPNHQVVFEQVLWDEVKVSGDHISSTTGMNTLKRLVNIFFEKVQARSADYEDLVGRGKVIFNALLRHPYNQFVRPNDTRQNLVKDIMERLILSPKFRENKKNYNLYTLVGILDSLPTLNEQAQKLGVSFIFEIYIDYSKEWISRHPLFYNEMLTNFAKRPRDLPRGYKVKFLAINCPGSDMGKIERAIQSLAPLSHEEFCYISSTQPQLLKCLGREPTDEDRRLVEYGKYQVIPNHMEHARPFIEKGICLPASYESFLDLSSLLKWVDFINMDNPKLINYLNPHILEIKGERIEPDTFKDNIRRLVNVLQNRTKIIGAPEDVSEREKTYAELQLYLAHISHLLSQRDIQNCSGFLLALAEIGGKCFTQFLEIPSLYHSLIGQIEVPVVPSWVDPSVLNMPFSPSKNVPQETFNGTLIKQLNNRVSAIEQKQVAFSEPIDSAEFDYVYHVMKQKMKIIFHLVRQLDEVPTYVCALEKFLSIMNQQSPKKLIDEMRSLEDRLSLAWMISYMKKYSLNIYLMNWINNLVKGELEGKTDPNVKFLKKILCSFYGVQDDPIKEALQKISSLINSPEKLSEGLQDVARTVELQTTFYEPKHLGDKLLVMLHNYRWNLLYDELAILPNALTLNIHNARFLELKASEQFKLYKVSSGQSQHEDDHVFPEARREANMVNFNIYFKYLCSPSFILKKVKAAILNSDPNNTISFEELIDWFKNNVPGGMTFEQVRNDLFDEEYKIKDKWLIYLLEKTGIIDKRL